MLGNLDEVVSLFHFQPPDKSRGYAQITPTELLPTQLMSIKSKNKSTKKVLTETA